MVPKMVNIPFELKNLTPGDVRILRSFTIHTGAYERQQSGYRVKKGMFRVSIDPNSVANKIEALDNEEAKTRCTTAFAFLMNNERSSYKHFLDLRNQLLLEDKPFNAYNMAQTEGIECALWPSIYPFTNWRESTISGRDSWLSAKRSFLTKVISSIIDYSLILNFCCSIMIDGSSKPLLVQ